MKALKRLLPLALALVLALAGCAQSGGASSGSSAASSSEVKMEDVYTDRVELGEVLINDEGMDVDAEVDVDVDVEDGEISIPDGDVPLAGSPALPPEASGRQVKENSRAKIDYSNISDGYVMVNFTGTTTKRLKALVQGPSYASTKLQYQYDLTAGQWTTLPLSDGNGSYTVAVLENTTGTKYAQVVSVKFNVSLTDEFAPFLRPNQYVDYSKAPKTVEKAKELAKGESDPLKLVEVIYQYVVNNLSYDKQLAATVKSGYLPNLDNVLAAKKGICFDYAALMTGMLRSQGVPCKLVTGYVPLGNGQTGYHAWISVWSEETGWVEGAVYFDGRAWQRMDPTFASSGHSSDSIMQFIGNGSNYTVKYVY